MNSNHITPAEGRRSHPVALLLAILTLISLAAGGSWIAFGPGILECSTPFLSVLIRDYVSADMECRLIFGLGAGITTGVLLMAIAEAVRDWGGWVGLGRWLHKCGMAMLFVGVLPLIVLVLLLMLASILAQLVREKIAGKATRGDTF